MKKELDLLELGLKVKYAEQMNNDEFTEWLGNDLKSESEEEIEESWRKLVEKLKREGIWRED